MRPGRALVLTFVVTSLASACHDQAAAPSVPVRSCSVTVWYRPSSPASNVTVLSSWDEWASPGTSMVDQQDGWRALQFDGLAAGAGEYVIVDDGDRVLDPNVGTTAFHEGQEVTWVDVPDCTVPSTQVDAVTPGVGGEASIDATFLATQWADPIDPTSVTLSSVHGATPKTATPTVDPSTGKVHIDLTGLPPGKATLAVQAKDTKGRVAQAALATVWTEAQPFSWQDAVIYEVMVDRYRARDGSALVPPGSMGGRAGGNVAGVTTAVVSGELQALGVNTLWLTPLYDNPDGSWPGLDGHEYSSYHGYWPSQPRASRSRWPPRADVDALVAAAHARGMRVLFDVVPHHVHTEHPYWTEHGTGGWFQDTGGSCVCGVGSCTWATDETACWFTSYLPSLDWTNDTVASTVSDDVRWWLDRFDGDGVRIDAVPMMPRAAIRRIAWDARQELDNPSNQTFLLGEELHGARRLGEPALLPRPHGARQQFHFPLMWALRGALAQGTETMADVEATIRTGRSRGRGRAP